MDTHVLKTLDWSECGMPLTSLAVKTFGSPPKANITDFAKFVHSFATVGLKSFAGFLGKTVNRYDFEDYSAWTMAAENGCLFSCGPASALEIILRHLKILNSGGKVPARWCFLDDEHKAVVHFVKRKGWYAEAFFTCKRDRDFSVLHLLKNKDEHLFVPVVFAEDISHYVSLAEANGSCILQEYLPRETFELLSKKSGKKKSEKTDVLPTDDIKAVAFRDKDDLL